MCVCVYTYAYTHMSSGNYWVVEMLGPMDLELQTVMIHLMWVLGTTLRLSRRAVPTLNPKAVSSTHAFLNSVASCFPLNKHLFLCICLCAIKISACVAWLGCLANFIRFLTQEFIIWTLNFFIQQIIISRLFLLSRRSHFECNSSLTHFIHIVAKSSTEK